MHPHASLLQEQRIHHKPTLPELLLHPISVSIKKHDESKNSKSKEDLSSLFPKTQNQPFFTLEVAKKKQQKALRVGAVFSGGQAPGGHNVIAGLFDALKAFHPESHLFGFLMGPSGIVNSDFIEITKELLAPYRNQGGFDLLGSGRTKIETLEQMEAAKKCVESIDLDGLIIIGGDDSNTNAALLAEFFLEKGCKTKVIGVPKTIDGDLQNKNLPISFGFDTACKVYSEMIGNLAKDALSAKKYTHFIKLMGRSASHIALECALQTHPNITLIGEEIFASKKTLAKIVEDIADVIVKREKLHKNYGIILIPEGMIEFVLEIKTLISELNKILAENPQESRKTIASKLSSASQHCFSFLPEIIQNQLVLDRDPHGNVQVSLIETEKLLSSLVSKELEKRKKEKTYSGKFNPIHHFFGYEGRAALPSNFDANYCYALGHIAAILVAENLSGYMCAIPNILEPVEKWSAMALPLTSLINLEVRSGKTKPVIKKALVDLKGKAFGTLLAHRKSWEVEDDYSLPGPIQFFGPKEITESLPRILTP